MTTHTSDPIHDKKTALKEKKIIKQLHDQIAVLEKEKIWLIQDKKEYEEMAKRAQYDYINLKMDFDRYSKMQEEWKETQKIEILLETIKKFLPFVENLRKSLDNLQDDAKKNPLAQGLQLMYNKFLSTLASFHIKPIEAIGLSPDNLLHEAVSLIPCDNKKMRGKIMQEFERGFIYQKNNEQKVITTSKVVIGQ